MPRKSTATPGCIRVGIGGWSYAPWRGTFYPKGLRQADELAYAASQLGVAPMAQRGWLWWYEKPDSPAKSMKRL